MRGLLLFLAVPLVEMFSLFVVSEEIGAVATLALVIITAVIGVQVLKRQGMSTLTRANLRMQSGELPALEVMESMFVAISGVCLLIPGVISDTLGVLLLIPPVRRFFARRVLRSGRFNMGGGGSPGPSSFQTFHFSTRRSSRRDGRSGYQEDDVDVFEGEYSKEESGRRLSEDDRDR